MNAIKRFVVAIIEAIQEFKKLQAKEYTKWKL
jgi:hypothetical protein